MQCSANTSKPSLWMILCIALCFIFIISCVLDTLCLQQEWEYSLKYTVYLSKKITCCCSIFMKRKLESQNKFRNVLQNHFIECFLVWNIPYVCNALFFFIFVLVVLGIVDLKKKVYSYSTAINAAAAASSASRMQGPSSQMRKS